MYTANLIEFAGLVHTLTKSLSYVTSALHMTKDSGSLSASGNIAVIINTNHKYDIHHIVLSGYLKATAAGSIYGGYSGGIAGGIIGTNTSTVEVHIHNIMVLGH